MAITTDGLIAEWVAKLATGTGPGTNSPYVETWVDIVGAYDGALAGFTPDTASGWAGAGTALDPYCLVFAGTDDTVDTGDLSAGEDLTVSYEVWFKTTSGGSSLKMVGDASSLANTNDKTHMGLNAAKLFGQQSDRSYQTATIASTASVNGGEWTHGVLTIDGSYLLLYVNGTSDADAVAVYSATLVQDQSGIGFSNDQLPDGFFIGSIATVRVYSKALSSGEVAANYAAGILAASTDSAVEAPVLSAAQVGSDIQISWT